MWRTVKFIHKFEQEGGYGALVIKNSDILASSVNFLPKLYAAYKHAIEERYNINVCGSFYKSNNTEVRCMFVLNLAYAEKRQLDQDLYIQKFKDTFDFWIIGFEALLRSILFDIEHADRHTEETQDEIRKRIFTKKTAALKLYISMYGEDSETEIQKLRARRKQAKKARKAKARQKAAQQNPSHQD